MFFLLLLKGQQKRNRATASCPSRRALAAAAAVLGLHPYVAAHASLFRQSASIVTLPTSRSACMRFMTRSRSGAALVALGLAGDEAGRVCWGAPFGKNA